MNSINFIDVVRIKKLADGISSDNVGIGPAGVFCPIREYCFETPVNLVSNLEEMWDNLGKADMKKFAPIVAASAFKNRGKQEEIELSPFNYQF